MSVVSKIQDLKTTVSEQNEVVKTLRKDRQETRNALSALYGPLVRYRGKFISEATAAETEKQVPEMTTEDMSRLPIPTIVEKMARLFVAISGSLEETRLEVHGIHREIGAEVDAAMEEWRTLRAADDVQKQQQAFREGIYTQATPNRAATPEPIKIPITAPATPPVDLAPTPVTSGKKGGKASKTDQSKSGTSTLSDYVKSNPLSPTAAKSAKDTDTSKPNKK